MEPRITDTQPAAVRADACADAPQFLRLGVAHRACAIQRGLRHLSLLSIVFFRCNFADSLVTLYGASSIGRCVENAAGEISARDTNGSII